MSSGNFIVRLGRGLHASLKDRAKAQCVSLNDLCMKRLTLPSALEGLGEDLVKALTAIAAICGTSLVGVVIFGSWAREEANDLSDVDVLVVLDSPAKINRSLYRQWEAKVQDAHKVEPHFVALPARDDKVSGLWAEVSLDGVIVTDRDFRVQHYLRHVRKLIVSGQLVSKRLHGQNYWVHVEVA